ncbi:MAG: mucoidy inhibitor MuiA family protein [Chloroflexota bacterium]
MKKIFPFILLVSASFNLAAQNEKEIKAEIKHVTVFPDRAQVNHEAPVSLVPGRTVLKLTGLSPYIDAQSVQVKGFGEFTILSVNQQNNFLQNLEDIPEMKSIRSQIEELQMKIEDEKAAISVLQEKASFLTTNKALLLKETNTSAEQVKSIMDLYTANMEQVTMTTLKKQRQIKEYEKQISVLQQQVSTRLEKQQLPSGEITINVSNEKQVSGRLSISYVVTNAGWYPSYDIRVDDTRNPVTISYKANVFQNTGNAWKDVKLSFSNATPWVSGNIPVLYPWFIDFPQMIQPVLRGRVAGVKSEAMPAMVEVSEAKALDEVSYVQATGPEVQKQVGETTVTFDIAMPYSIPSDGRMQTVEIQSLTSPAEYKYLTLPKESQLAYLTANITNWAELSLQSGEATLYFENSFVGKSYLNVNQLTDTLTVSLGTDNSLLVKREKRKDFTSRRILGSNKTETYSFLITLRNNKPNPVNMTVKDQIPVSSNSSIEVEAVELSGGKYNSGNGFVTWDLSIKPGETRQLILTYSVKYPKDKNLILE